MKRILLIFTFLLSFSSFGDSSVGIKSNLQWQKFELENEILKQYSEKLKLYLVSRPFQVNVKVEIDEPIKPSFGSNPGSNKSKSKVRPTNARADKPKEDSIVFAKFGLEVPVIDEVELKSNLIGKAQGKPDNYFSDLWEFRSNTDLFKNLLAISIDVYLPNTLPKETQKKIEEILNDSKSRYGDVIPTLKFSYKDYTLKFKETKKKNNEKAKKTFINDLFSKWDKLVTGVGILLGALILGVFGLLIMSKFEKLNVSSKAEVSGDTGSGTSNKPSKTDESQNSDESVIEVTKDDNTNKVKGIERFCSLLSNNKETAVRLVKVWISSKNSNIIGQLTKDLKNEELESIFECLSNTEKMIWEELLQVKSNKDSSIIDRELNDEVVKSFITENLIFSDATLDLIFNIDAESCGQMLSENPEIMPVVFKVFTEDFIKEVLDHTSDENLEDGLIASIVAQGKNLKTLQPKFEKILPQYTKHPKLTPGLDKALSILKITSSIKEVFVYKAIIKEMKVVDARKLVLEFIPSELIPSIPDNIKKVLLTKYPLGKKVELLMSIDSSLKENFLNSYAPKGSMAEELISMEMNRAESDLMLQKRIREDKSEIWEEYVKFSRNMITTREDWKDELSEFVENWIKNSRNDGKEDLAA